VPNQYDVWQADVLTEGLVLTIEPMITAGFSQPLEDADGWTIRTGDGSLSPHHEHTIMITRVDAVILTAAQSANDIRCRRGIREAGGQLM
jgi:methionyl aminopeptidase